jgi:dienelactone hydrolase
MRSELVEYTDGETTFEAYVACDDKDGKHPCVVIAPAWAGVSDLEKVRANKLAEQGYCAIVLDVYGKGTRGDTEGDNTHLIAPLMQDRKLLLKRLQAGIKAAKEHKLVDAQKIAAAGYCFGGLCVLDIARSGNADVKGVASFHGLFVPPEGWDKKKISAKVLVLHGYDDPWAKPDSMTGLAGELTEAEADWQIHAYGNTVHAFTVVGANAPERGAKYSASADHRSWAAFENFLKEVIS